MKKVLLLGLVALMSNVFMAQNSGAYIAPGEWRIFLDHNLGADTSLDRMTPAAGIHGAKYQWGTATTIMTQSADQASSAPWPYPSWPLGLAANGSWGDPKTANDPCPSGYRVPTRAEWEGVLANNTVTRVGTWTYGSTTNYTSGIKIGNDLFLPAAGYRFYTAGTLVDRGFTGDYQSVTEYPAGGSQGTPSTYIYVNHLQFDEWSANIVQRDKRQAAAVRCIKETSSPAYVLGTGENTAEQNNLIYPNPAKNVFHLSKNLSGESRVEVYDSFGRLMIQEVNQSSRAAVPITNLSNGIYLVKVTNKGKVSMGRLSVQK